MSVWLRALALADAREAGKGEVAIQQTVAGTRVPVIHCVAATAK